MASFGQGINPQLGAINYQPYLQGAAQGSAAVGQGIGQLLQGAGQAVQQYYAKQEEKKQFQGFTDYAKKVQADNPELWKQAGLPDVSDNGAFKTYLKALGAGNQAKGIAVAAPMLTQFAQQAEGDKSAKRVAAIENMMIANGGNLPGVIPQNLNPAELNKATSNVAKYFQQLAETQKTLAEADKLSLPPKAPDLSFQEQTLAAQVQAFQATNGRSPNAVELSKIYSDIQRAPQTSITLPPNESAYASSVGSDKAKEDTALHTNAIQAAEQLPKLNQALDLIRNGAVETGSFADTITKLRAIQSKFMNDKEAAKSVSDTQLLDSMLGSDVFPMIGSLGIGARGLDTPAERDFLRSVMTGTIGLNKDALERMTKIRMDIAKRSVEKYNKAVESGSLDEFFKARREKGGIIELPKENTKPAVDRSPDFLKPATQRTDEELLKLYGKP